jgi:hypothetical protein
MADADCFSMFIELPTVLITANKERQTNFACRTDDLNTNNVKTPFPSPPSIDRVSICLLLRLREMCRPYSGKGETFSDMSGNKKDSRSGRKALTWAM